MDDLDQVFADIPRAGTFEACVFGCFSAAEIALLSGDPALIPDELVWSVSSGGTVCVGDQQQFSLLYRALMPRILRAFEKDLDGMFLNGLDYAEFSAWPAEERAAVDRFLRGVFDRAVLGGAEPAAVLELLSCLAHLDDNPGYWLGYLDAMPVAADTVLCELARYLAEEFTERADPDPLWPEAFRDWLYSDALYERITRIGSRDTLIAIAEM